MNKTNLIGTIILLSMILGSCSPQSHVGKYQVKKASYGKFTKILTLECDSIAQLNFKGGLMNDISYGKWSKLNDTLIVNFDTIMYPNSRYKKAVYFRIKRNKLEPLISPEFLNGVNPEERNELQILIQKTDYNSLKYYRNHHFIRIEDTECLNFDAEIE